MTKQDLKCYIKDSLRAIRKKRGLTQEELAELAGISTAYCTQIETGVRTPTVFVLLKLADALNVSLDFLVRGPNSGIKQNELSYLIGNKSDKQLEFLINFIELMDQYLSRNHREQSQLCI